MMFKNYREQMAEFYLSYKNRNAKIVTDMMTRQRLVNEDGSLMHAA